MLFLNVRIPGDNRVTETVRLITRYPRPLNIEEKFQYPIDEIGALITYVEIVVDQVNF